jgi:hypothetical protein
MRLPLCLLGTAVALILLCTSAHAITGQDFDLDIGSHSPGSVVEITVDPGTVNVLISNRLPNPTAYTISVIRRSQLLPALESGASLPFPTQTGKKTNPCTMERDSILADIVAATTESRVLELRKSISSRLKAKTCTDIQKAQLIGDIHAATSFTFPVTIRAGEETTVTVSRSDGNKSLTWVVRFTTKPRGVWLTTYGVGIIPDDDDRFWLKPTANPGEFTVTNTDEGKHELHAIPTILFHWFPEKAAYKDFSFGPTAGFGAGGERLAFYAGYSALYNSVLQFSAGASAFQVTRLADRYVVGDTVRTNVSDDELHRKTIHIDWFAALTFRFGSNPFKKAEEATSPSGAQP